MISTVVFFQHAGDTSAASCKLEALQSHLKPHPLNSLANFFGIIASGKYLKICFSFSYVCMCAGIGRYTRVQEGTSGVQKKCQILWHCSCR